jgi:hypothetical protein
MEQNSTKAISSNATVLETTTLLASPSQPKQINTDSNKSGLIAKVPVVISQTRVQVYLDSTIKFDHPVLEILETKQNVNLTRCELMDSEDENKGKLIIAGFLKKNISYTTPKTIGENAVIGEKCYATANVPFKCFAKVNYEAAINLPQDDQNTPADAAPAEPQANGLAASSFGDESLELRNTVTQKNNEKLSYELVEAKISQVESKQDFSDVDFTLENIDTFSSLSEKILIDLILLVSQNQYVQIFRSGQSNNKSSQNSQDNSQKKESSESKKKK